MRNKQQKGCKIIAIKDYLVFIHRQVLGDPHPSLSSVFRGTKQDINGKPSTIMSVNMSNKLTESQDCKDYLVPKLHANMVVYEIITKL